MIVGKVQIVTTGDNMSEKTQSVQDQIAGFIKSLKEQRDSIDTAIEHFSKALDALKPTSATPKPISPQSVYKPQQHDIDVPNHTLRDLILYALSVKLEMTSHEMLAFLESIGYRSKAKTPITSIVGTCSNLQSDKFVEYVVKRFGLKSWRLTAMGTARAERVFFKK